MKREDDLVWEYTVYWFSSTLDIFFGEMSRTHFASWDDARKFSKKKYKELKNRFGKGRTIKPFIVRDITVRKTFREDIKCEFLTEEEMKKYHNNLRSTYPRLVK